MKEHNPLRFNGPFRLRLDGAAAQDRVPRGASGGARGRRQARAARAQRSEVTVRGYLSAVETTPLKELEERAAESESGHVAALHEAGACN